LKEPKDWDGFYNGMENDPPHEALVGLARMIGNGSHTWETFEIILLTGRSEKYRAATMDWLRRNEIEWNQLFMRPDGFHAPDTDFKFRCYTDHIAPHYDVKLVFEDRPAVVAMWRDAGLTCLACNDHLWWRPEELLDCDEMDHVEWLELMARQHEHDTQRYKEIAAEMKALRIQAEAYMRVEFHLNAAVESSEK
jgi:hypothetical protein